MTKFKIVSKIFFLFAYFDAVLMYLLPGEFASVFQVKQIGMIAK